MAPFNPSQKVFITGATGYIGSIVTELAVKEGYSVRGLSRRGDSDTLLESLGATPVRGDLTDSSLLTEESKNADLVLHLAFDHDFTKPYDQLLKTDITAGTTTLSLLGMTADQGSAGQPPSTAPALAHTFKSSRLAQMP